MDSGASAHMTNKNEYFVDDRKRVINRYVKVKRERKILVDLINKAIIEIGDKKLIFQKCLYIFGLKVNFLLIKRLYEQDFKESFNKKTMYLKLLNKDLILKTLIKKKIYIVNWIKFKLDMAFIINEFLYHKQNVYIRLLHMASHTDEDYLHELKDKHDKSDIDFDNYLL